MAEEKTWKAYGIAFKGLKEGDHFFEYELGDAFFGLFEQPQVETGDLKARVRLIKTSRMLELEFTIEGEAGTICDRCLGPVNVPVHYEGTLYVNFGERFDEPTEEIVVLPYEEHTINIAQYLYEFIVVSMPIRHVHADKEDGTPGCDPEMLEKLNTYLVDEEEENTEDSDEEPIDPRWAELKKLKDQDKNNK
jgi:uncharacterized metal-binding protein YceD (DUF177 family)